MWLDKKLQIQYVRDIYSIVLGNSKVRDHMTYLVTDGWVFVS